MGCKWPHDDPAMILHDARASSYHQAANNRQQCALCTANLAATNVHQLSAKLVHRSLCLCVCLCQR